MAWTDTVFKFLGLARYNTVTPALSNGQTSEWQCDAQGRLLVNNQSIATVWNDAGAAAAEKLIKSQAGKFYSVRGRNTGGSTRYLFLFNHAAAGGSRPVNGSTGELFFPIAVAAGASFEFAIERARAFATGLYWGVSSTDSTFTYDAAATFRVAVEYE